MAADGSYSYATYGEYYFTKDPYSPYWDFNRHDGAFARFVMMMQPRSVLDVGCAYGYIVRRCLEGGVPAVGLDVSMWCGQQKVIPGFYIMGTGWALPFKDNAFDVLHCEGVLEHIPEDKIEQLMAEFDRVASRRYLGISYEDSDTPAHICVHPVEWWYDRVPIRTYLGETGRSLDLEDKWLYKDRPCVPLIAP